MTTYKRPGVYFSEAFAPNTPAIQSVGTPSLAIIGVADKGPIDEPKLITRFSDFQTWFGDFNSDSYLADAIYNYFANGGAEAYVLRVAASDAVVATDNLVDRAATPADTLQIDAINTGAWGNDIYVGIRNNADTTKFDLEVFSGGAGAAYLVEKFEALSMLDSDARYVEKIVNDESAGSRYIEVTDLDSTATAPSDMPAAGLSEVTPTYTQLISGTNGVATIGNTDWTNALSLFDVINFPLVFILPDKAGNTTVINAAIAYCAARGDCFFIADPAAASSVATVQTLKDTLTASDYAQLNFPWIKAQDASVSTAVQKLYPPSIFVAGQMANVDTKRGVWKAAAGLETKIAGAIGVEAKLTNTDIETLNNVNINCIVNKVGTGICIWGARTLSTNINYRYATVRRSLIKIRYDLTNSTEWAVFEINDSRLWTSLESICTAYLKDLWLAGGLKGNAESEAFSVTCDDSTNPQVNINAGKVTIKIGVALQRPGEFIIFEVSQMATGN